MFISRILIDYLKERVFLGKAIIVFGPRQSGKTTAIKKFISDSKVKTCYFDGDDPSQRKQFEDVGVSKLSYFFGDCRIVFIDEAQNIPGIGKTIKLIVDHFPNIQVIATGSSSFDLSGKVQEPLTGRKFEFSLLPLSFDELVRFYGLVDEMTNLENRLVFGNYPEIVASPEFSRERLKLLSNSYIYKDVLMLGNIKKTYLAENILKLLAYQVGSEVSYQEIGRNIGADNETVEKYIELLEKAYIIFKLPAFSNNLRNEIRKKKKIYFYDNGIRNSIIADFRDISLRNDIGKLWENFVVSEIKKKKSIYNSDYEIYFWRNTQKQEIDLILTGNEKKLACEIKWNQKKKVKFPRKFIENYKNFETRVINPDNFYEFLINLGQ